MPVVNIIEDLLLLAASTYADPLNIEIPGYKYNRGPIITSSEYL